MYSVVLVMMVQHTSLQNQGVTLCIAHLNCCSLVPHKYDVVGLFIKAQLDVLETWINDTVRSFDSHGSGFSLISAEGADQGFLEKELIHARY